MGTRLPFGPSCWGEEASGLVVEAHKTFASLDSGPCSGCGVQGAGFRVQGSGFRVQGSGFRVQGSGFRVQGS